MQRKSLFSKWLDEVLKKKDMKPNELVRKINESAKTEDERVTFGAVYGWLKRDQEPKLRTALRVCEVLGVSPPFIPPFFREICLPYVGALPAGNPQEVYNVQEMIDIKGFFPDDAYVVRARGDSMVGAGILEGDFLVIVPCQELVPGAVHAIRVEGESTLKYARREGNKIRLIPANPEHKAIDYDPKVCEVMGRVVTVLRSLSGVKQSWFRVASKTGG